MIKLCGVSAGYSSADVIRDISFEAEGGQIIALIGKNGCGKSTLLKVCARQLKASAGTVFVDNKEISSYSPKEVARKISLLPQVRNVPEITARALVMHGRFPYMPFPRVASREDKRAVERAMEITDTAKFGDISVASLSGGERQRVYLAMLLAQDTSVVLMDEPSTFLDLKTQFDVTDTVRALKSEGKTVIAVMHDLSEAMRACDRVLLMHEGHLEFDGSPDSLYDSGLIERCMQVVPHKTECDSKTVYFFTPK